MPELVIDTKEHKLTVIERRPDPITGEEQEVVISTHQLNGSPLDVDFSLRSISQDEDGKARLEVEGSEITDLTRTHADFWEEVNSALGIEYRHGDVRLNDEKSAAQNYRDFTRFLVDRDYLTTDELPLSLPSANNRVIVNDAPYHQGGTEMTRGEEIAEDIYIDVNASADTIRRYIETLAERLVPA